MSENGNSPAYPVEVEWLDGKPRGKQTSSRSAWESGLTKREAFAMAAMQGFLANEQNGSEAAADIAQWSVVTADALLAELAKDTP